MLNLTKYQPGAEYFRHADPAGRPEGRYAPVSVLAAIGASLCFAADVIASTGGWHWVTVVSYPSRRAFVSMADRPDFREWHRANSDGIAEVIVMGLVPVGRVPEARSARTLLEVWHGAVPAPVADGSLSTFDVEGTILGDGRQWTGARYTSIASGTALPLRDAIPSYQALLLEPVVERWR